MGLERELLQAQRRANAAVFRGGKAVCLTGAESLMEGVEAGDVEGGRMVGAVLGLHGIT